MKVQVNYNTIIINVLPFLNYSRAYLTLKRSIMKTSLLLGVLVCTICYTFAQNSTKSTLTFNQLKGLSETQQKELNEIYHDMSDHNYHCFILASDDEKAFHQQSKLISIIKARALAVENYYEQVLGVAPDNVFIKYGGDYPTLWLHKPKGRLTASGNIDLDDNDRECYSFNTGTNKMITSANGNRFYFPANAFETMAGMSVDNQTIKICLWEFMDKSSLVFSGLTTDANGKMLETAGSFYIEATLNGEQLRLKKGESYTVEMRSEKSFPDMFTYYGSKKDGLIDWEVNPKEKAIANGNIPGAPALPVQVVSPNEGQKIMSEEGNYLNEWGNNTGNTDGAYFNNPELKESVEAVDFYEMSAGKLGWINCDRFYDAKNTSTIAIRVDTDKSMVVRLVFRDINSVMPCYANSNHKDQYEATGIPVGEKVLVLAYSVKDENAVLGYKEVTIGENDTEYISLNNLSKTRFKSAVKELLY